MDTKLSFEPKARLLLQLGDQLIRSESIALLEIIKNSYDANASVVRVSMKNIDNPASGEIVIEDDGIGMDADIIKNIWMQPGTDYKWKIIQGIKKVDKKNRIPIGEKGIGRFGVHKLGFQIELVSRKENKKEIMLKMNWKDFDTDDLLVKIPVVLRERGTPEYFTGKKTGTRVIIRDLKNAWTREAVRELYRSVNSLSSPFETLDSFRVYFNLDKQEWLAGLVTFDDIKNHALYYGECIIENNSIKRLKYEFRPWDTMSKLQGRKHELRDVRMVEQVLNSDTGKMEWVDIDLSKHKLGVIKFKILIFDRASKILSLGLTDKKGFKEYLDINGGVRVFRSGIRVYDYGERSNDWLGLDIRRVNQPGKTLSNNIIIGAVYLDRVASADLEEKTNREGFVENAAYFKFLSAVNFALEKILTERNTDKEKVRKLFSPTAPDEPVMGNLKILQDKIIKEIPKGKFRNELVKTIKDIEADYKMINQIYTRSASAGLSLGIVIHEVSKIIDELLAAVDEIPSHKHIVSLVKILHKTVSDYAGVIKQSTKSKEDLIEIIDQALSNIQFRIKAHKIEIIKSYKKRSKINAVVKCAPNLIISTIINLIDNSIWWQNYANIKSKKIIIDITEEHKGYTSILIADNGPGFSISPEEAVKPFISDKPGGMGLGLHLAYEVMNGQRGELIFPEVGDYDLPSEFKHGARLLLAFKR
ncbi:MAG: ATP-binding protein [Candidatus Margulisiibacteriota bacterium]